MFFLEQNCTAQGKYPFGVELLMTGTAWGVLINMFLEGCLCLTVSNSLGGCNCGKIFSSLNISVNAVVI